ncbi:MAG: hypothetical protein FWB95_05770 [Treponema sp.]|nr:hypothetical protein [Treponema sp.]
MRKIGTGAGLLFFIFAVFITGCNNYFHDLIPPDENRILSFNVEGQIGNAEISDFEINITVNNESPLTSLLPNITISEKAVIFPVTLEYIASAFPSIDVMKEIAAIYGASDLSKYVMDLIERTPEFNIPKIDKPINFSGPVYFIVVSGMGTTRQYAVNLKIDTGEPRLLSMGFSKYDNPELIKDASTMVLTDIYLVNASFLYPVEIPISYRVIPSFEILGDRLEVDGVEIKSGIDAINFNKMLGHQQKTLTVWRNGMSLDYTLFADFELDPDSARSITDFRFYASNKNPSLVATAVGSIINSGALGSISVQVFYDGARPDFLTPDFISPGNVYVEGILQESGMNSHDFSNVLEYRVVSKNNMYVRTYSVIVELIDIASAAPVFTSFRFTSNLNPEIVQDTEGQISDSTGIIMITVRYGGLTPPEVLIPQFSASGIVTVMGAVQTSSFSPQNFTNQVRYTVTHPVNSMMSRNYWVQTSFIRDTSSDAAITYFSFHPDENNGLLSEIVGHIDHNAGTISLFAPPGSGVIDRIMFARYKAAGIVRVDGDAQTSGVIGRIFDKPIVYEAVSANGNNRKLYTVKVRELRTRIFVKADAVGLCDGTSWEDAFRNIQDASKNALTEFPADVPKEIWIARGVYYPSFTQDSSEFIPLAPNTTFTGGFAGNENDKNARIDTASNKVVVSGNLGGGAYSSRLFSNNFSESDSMINLSGDLTFEDMAFTGARASSESGEKRFGGAINLSFNSASDKLAIKNCAFSDLQAYNGGAVYARNGIVEITNSAIDDAKADSQGGALYLTGNGNAVLTGLSITNCKAEGQGSTSGGGIYSVKQLTINGINMDKVSANYGGAIYNSGQNLTMSGSPSSITNSSALSSGGAIYTTGITSISSLTIDNATSSSGGGVYSTHRLTITGSTFKNITSTGSSSGAVYHSNSSESITVSGSEFNNITFQYALYANNMTSNISGTKFTNITGSAAANGSALYVSSSSTSGSIIINNVNIDGVTNGRGIYISSARSLLLMNTSINNCQTTLNGAGIDLTNAATGNAELSGFTITNTKTTNTTGAINVNNSGTLRILGNSLIFNTQSTSRAVSISGNGFTEIAGNSSSPVTISDITASYALYAYNNTEGTSINIAGLRLNNITAQSALYVSYPAIAVTNTYINNFTGTAGTGRSAMYVTSSGSITIDNTHINGAANGRGMFISSSNWLSLNNSTINNCKSTDGGGGLYLTCWGTSDISAITITNTYATGNDNDGFGGGMYIYNSGTFRLHGRSEISNVQAAYGAGIYFGGTGNFEIAGTGSSPVIIKNATASKTGGGIYGPMHESSNLVINYLNMDDVISQNIGGGLYFYGATLTVNNSTFLNVTARHEGKIIELHPRITSLAAMVVFPIYNYSNCTFTHNSSLRDPGPGSTEEFKYFISKWGRFDNCTFNYLRAQTPGENYIFNSYARYRQNAFNAGTIDPRNGIVVSVGCNFNLNGSSAAVCAFNRGRLSDGSEMWDFVIFDRLTVNTGGLRPVFYFSESVGQTSSDTYTFYKNTRIDGGIVDSQYDINNYADCYPSAIAVKINFE